MAAFSRAFVILNPAACHGRAVDGVSRIRSLLRGRIDFELSLTTEPWHAQALARGAVREGYDLIVAAGGDGTAHEAANGIMAETGRVEVDTKDASLQISGAQAKPGTGRPRAPAMPVLAVLPLGSGNDYAHTLGMSSKLSMAIDEIISGETRKVDAGTCNGVIFTNSVGMGFDGRVTHRALEMRPTARLSGFPLYFAALTDILRHDFHGYRARLSIDRSEPAVRPFLMLTVTHGPTYGGGFKITPQAINGDGLFDYCLVDDLSLADALWRVPLVVLGRHNWMKKVMTGRAEHIVLEADEELFAQLDGEPYRASRFELSVLPSVLTAVVGRRWKD